MPVRDVEVARSKQYLRDRDVGPAADALDHRSLDPGGPGRSGIPFEDRSAAVDADFKNIVGRNVVELSDDVETVDPRWDACSE
jgi:hypothetical protein